MRNRRKNQTFEMNFKKRANCSHHTLASKPARLIESAFGSRSGEYIAPTSLKVGCSSSPYTSAPELDFGPDRCWLFSQQSTIYIDSAVRACAFCKSTYARAVWWDSLCSVLIKNCRGFCTSVLFILTSVNILCVYQSQGTVVPCI